MAELNVGDIIPFGKYDWRILAENEGKRLIITEKIIELRAFHSDDTYYWKDCDLCQYLNGAFYDTFSPAEQSRIADTRIQFTIKPRYPKHKWNFSTHKIFVLSIDEAGEYFKDDDDREAKYELSIDEAKVFYENDDDRMAEYGNILIWAWWLRYSAYTGHEYAPYVLGEGRIFADGRPADHEIGVRPALWLAL